MLNIIFDIKGGLGKNIIATAVIRAIKKQYHESNLIVVSGYPAVFLNNPNIYRVYNHSNRPYFYDDHIKGKEVLLLSQEPYLHQDYVQYKKHLSETWCSLFGVKFDGVEPEIFLTTREKIFYSRKYLKEKPLLLIQTNGGAQDQKIPYSWSRDIPFSIGNQIVEYAKEKYTVMQIRREDQLKLNCDSVQIDNFRDMMGLFHVMDKGVFNDSFGGIASAAVNKKAVVCWPIKEKCLSLGYESNDNIYPKEDIIYSENSDASYDPFGNLYGTDMYNCPFDDLTKVFSIDEIIKKIK